MDKKILFHVGLPKTGTTSLQVFLANNHSALSEAGVLFPVTEGQFGGAYGRPGRGQGPQADVTAFFYDLPTANPHPSGIEWETVFETFRADSRHGLMIVSHESQSMNADKLRPERYRAAIGSTPAEFVAYIREPVDWLNSFYIQSTVAWNAFSRKPGSFPGIRKYLKLGFEGLLAPFHDLGQVSLRNYDALRAEKALLPDFLSRIGAAHLAEESRAATELNTKFFRPEHILLLRELKAGDCDFDTYQAVLHTLRVIGRRTGRDQPRKLLLPRGLQKKIRAKWDDERPMLVARYGVDFAAPAPLPDTDPVIRLDPAQATEMRTRIADHLDPAHHAALDDAITRLGAAG